MPANGQTSVVWFRKGLRLHDNPALQQACTSSEHVVPVFCLDPHYISSGAVGPNRIRFLLESLEDLDKNLRDVQSRLVVLHGNPTDVLPRVVELLGAKTLCFEKDTEPYALSRDKAVAEALKVEVHSPVSHTLWDTEALIEKNKGKAPRTMTSFQALLRKMPKVAEALDCPKDVPQMGGKELDKLKELLWNGTGNVPSLKDLDIEEPPHATKFKGGETEGLERLKRYMAKEQWVCAFEKPKGNPAAFDPEPATTVLSPYLKFGCISPRLFYHQLKAIYAKHKKHSNPPVSLEGQLLWREFYYTVGLGTPSFEKMEGNPHIRQIPWDTKPELLKAWETAQTGYPWIDAIMTQLVQDGWMHHLARHSVACFLTRGDLWCHWEDGRDVFDKYLLDGDHFINNGNWHWLSASDFFYQYFRVYSPVAFGKKYDKHGAFVRHYLPVLKDMPDKYVYEPWTAPTEVQRKAKCIVGKDYPHPVVEHKEASKENMARMKAAYAANKGETSSPQQKRSRPDSGSDSDQS